MRTAVVLLAAGAGRRAGGKTPKQFLSINGEPLFMKSLRAFALCKSVKEMIVVCQPEHRRRIQSGFRRARFQGSWNVVEGGAYRGASVRNGVAAISSAADVVLVHDTARPFVTPAIISRVETSAYKYGAALAAWPLPDTLKLASSPGRVKKTIPRKNLWLAQTPQGFSWRVAQSCLLHPSPTATDDTELAERKGYRVRVVEGAVTNFKVTYPADVEMCRWLAR